MKIDRETNSTFKNILQLVGDENIAEKLCLIADYRRKHNIKDKYYIAITENLDDMAKYDEQNTQRKKRELSQATKDANYEKQLARLKAKYGKA